MHRLPFCTYRTVLSPIIVVITLLQKESSVRIAVIGVVELGCKEFYYTTNGKDRFKRSDADIDQGGYSGGCVMLSSSGSFESASCAAQQFSICELVYGEQAAHRNEVNGTVLYLVRTLHFVQPSR